MSLYHESMYRFAEPADSWWEQSLAAEQAQRIPLRGDFRFDVAVIGGGYTGLTTALHLARDHGLRVAVLEAGQPGWGASGRNGGFCCLYPSSLSLGSLRRRFGEDATRDFLRSQLQAIDLVRELAATESIDIEPQGEGVFEVAHAPGRFAELEQTANELRTRYGVAAATVGAGQFSAEVHRSTEQYGALHLRAGFGLNPLALARGLARAAERHGARIFPHSEVLECRREAARHRVLTSSGSVSCEKLVFATNGYTPEAIVPGLRGRSIPVISNIVVTRPLSANELDAQGWRTESPCSNTRRLLFYYRLLPDRRLLFGARGDTSGRPDASQRVRAWMERRLGELFPAWAGVPVTHYWRGFICASADGTPAIGSLDDGSMHYAMAYHGNGVAAAIWSGRLLAGLLTGATKPQDVPTVMRGPSPRLPLPAARLWYLRAALAWFRLQDRL